MRNTPDEPDQGGPDRPAPDTSPLLGIDAAAARLHAEFAQLLRLTLDAQEWGGTGHTAGCTVHDYLVFEAGLPGWLANQLESVARRIDAVPSVGELFWAGVLTFEQLAKFVRATSAYNGELLARLDEECASRAEALAESGRIRGWVHDVEMLVEDLRAPGFREREERRREKGQRYFAQQDFDGGGFIGKELDAVGFATELASVQAEVDPDEVAELGIQRARAAASVRIAEQYLAGRHGCHGDCGGSCCDGPVPARPARPTFVLHIDLADATQDRFGHLLRRAVGGDRMVPLSARTAGLFVEHAELICQVSDGARPVLELVAKDTDDIPAPIRRMVGRRDRGCRFPDCGAPMRLIHVHHLVPVSEGGTHDPENLILLCSFHHLRYVHKLGWTAQLDGATGRVTWTNTRTDTSMSTMPHGTRPPPRRDPSLLPDWMAPPRSPPPRSPPPDHLDPPGPALRPAHWLDPPPDQHDPPDSSAPPAD